MWKLVLTFMLLLTTFSYADELPFYISHVYDFPASTTIPKGSLEIGINYGRVDDNIDVFNIRKKELSSVSKAVRAESLGNYQHLKVFANYGLKDATMLHCSFAGRQLDYGTGTINAASLKTFIRQSFSSFLSFDVGIRENFAQNLKVRNVSLINYYLHKFRPDISIELDPNYIWFVKETTDLIIKYGVPRKEDPYFELRDMKDTTRFFRITVGNQLGDFYPNIFLEYGTTNAKTLIDTNLKDLVPEGFRSKLPQIPIDLSHNEKYRTYGFAFFLKIGSNLIAKGLYSYTKFIRNSNLNYVDYNRMLRLGVDIKVKNGVILTIEGKYLHRQFNGVLPFLYNKYSQTAFDHRYGWLEIGITFLFW